MNQVRMYIDGQWTESASGEFSEAYNPATLKPLAAVAQGTREDAGRALEAAKKAQRTFATLDLWDRTRLLHAIADVLERHAPELARVLCEDQGKPYRTEALAEVQVTIVSIRETAELARSLTTDVLPVNDSRKRVWSVRQPRGICGVITPWNFPILIPIEYIAPALAMGNTVVWVPAPTTSVCGAKLMECIEEAGVPAGVVNMVTGAGPVVGNELVRHPLTSVIGFTGSPPTGHNIAQQGAGKPMLLELGGNGPTIVLEDADLPRAAKAIANGCFYNAGQICSATERIIAASGIRRDLTDAIVEYAAQLKPGDPLEDETTLGPLNNFAVADKTERHIADCVEKGGRIVHGGRRAPEYGSRLFFQPTVIDGVTRNTLLNCEETFGPVAPIIDAGNDEEILACAADGVYGLVASVWTRDLKRAFAFADRLRAGLVTINEASIYWEPHIPFGGASGTQSGIGRIGGRHTLEALSDLKTIVVDLS